LNRKFEYRKGTIDDVEQLQTLGIVAYGQFKNVLTPKNWELLNGNLQNKTRLIELLKVANCFVCADNAKIIGMAFIIPSGNPTDLFRSEWSYIRMVGVDPNYQGQGIAKALTKLCIDFARQTNENTIALHTSEFMDAARHIYENLGFKILNEIPPIFGKKYWLYILNINK
jgi:ribosomal protein S18 acetylase RimI-like enzyme